MGVPPHEQVTKFVSGYSAQQLGQPGSSLLVSFVDPLVEDVGVLSDSLVRQKCLPEYQVARSLTAWDDVQHELIAVRTHPAPIPPAFVGAIHPRERDAYGMENPRRLPPTVFDYAIGHPCVVVNEHLDLRLAPARLREQPSA